MTLIRFHPFTERETLRQQIDCLFDEVFENSVLSKSDREATLTPAIELKETEKTFILNVQLPGIEIADLEISATRETISITGKRDREKKDGDRSSYRSEFRYGEFKRVVKLPIPVQNDKISANYQNGILTLALPKVAEAVNRVVKVSLESSKPAPLDAETSNAS